MTMKQALKCIIEYLDAREDLSEEVCIAKNKIQELLKGFPGKIWDDKAIRTAIERFIDENGRVPIIKELDSLDSLPAHTSIQRQYKMKAGEWLRKNYPEASDYNAYYRKLGLSKENAADWFRENFNKINPVSSVEFNKLRDKKTPTWQAYAKMLNVKTWNELKKKCGVEYKKAGKKYKVKTYIEYKSEK